MTDTEPIGADQWAVVELMGHVRLAGKVSEVERFGSKMGRIDIPIGPAEFVTQFFGGSAVYRISACDEPTARAVAQNSKPEPIHAWELPKMLPPALIRSQPGDPFDDEAPEPRGDMTPDFDDREGYEE